MLFTSASSRWLNLSRTSMVAKVLRNSSSNKAAKELKDRRYHQRVIKNKKAYDRKKISKDTYRDS